MYSLKDNYLALYLSIIKRYNPDQSLRAMGITEKNKPSNRRKIEHKEVKGVKYDIDYTMVEGGY